MVFVSGVVVLYIKIYHKDASLVMNSHTKLPPVHTGTKQQLSLMKCVQCLKDTYDPQTALSIRCEFVDSHTLLLLHFPDWSDEMTTRILKTCADARVVCHMYDASLSGFAVTIALPKNESLDELSSLILAILALNVTSVSILMYNSASCTDIFRWLFSFVGISFNDYHPLAHMCIPW